MADSIWVAGAEMILDIADAIGEFFSNLWDLIVEWMESFYQVWTERYLPKLKALATEAWVRLDRVLTPLKRAAKKAWRELRTYLLKQTIDVLELSPGSWGYEIISWFIPPENEHLGKVTMSHERRNVPFEELPDDVREQLIRRQQVKQIDVTKTRDEEMELVN